MGGDPRYLAMLHLVSFIGCTQFDLAIGSSITGPDPDESPRAGVFGEELVSAPECRCESAELASGLGIDVADLGAPGGFAQRGKFSFESPLLVSSTKDEGQPARAEHIYGREREQR